MRGLFLLTVLILLTTGCLGQTAGGREGIWRPKNPITKAKRGRSRPAGLVAFRRTLRNASEEIKRERPKIPESNLVADQKVIIESLPAIKVRLAQEGFIGKDVELAILAGWRHLRVQHLKPTARLSQRKFVLFVNTLGKVIITSMPDEAEVMIDKKQLSMPTKTSAFCTPGIHRIRLKKAGYQPVEDYFEIIGNGKLVFHRELKKQ